MELRSPAAPSEAREAQWSSGWSTSAAWVEPNADGDSKSAARRIAFRTGPSSARTRRTVTSTLVSLADTILERVITLTAPTAGTSAHRLPPVWLRSRRRSRRLWPLPSRRCVPAPTVRSSTGSCGRSHVGRWRAPLGEVLGGVCVADEGRVVAPHQGSVERRADARVGLRAGDDEAPDAERRPAPPPGRCPRTSRRSASRPAARLRRGDSSGTICHASLPCSKPSSECCTHTTGTSLPRAPCRRGCRRSRRQRRARAHRRRRRSARRSRGAPCSAGSRVWSCALTLDQHTTYWAEALPVSSDWLDPPLVTDPESA